MNNDIYIFHKTKVQTVILRCWKCSYLHWHKSYNIKRKFMIFSPVANFMHHPLDWQSIRYPRFLLPYFFELQTCWHWVWKEWRIQIVVNCFLTFWLFLLKTNNMQCCVTKMRVWKTTFWQPSTMSNITFWTDEKMKKHIFL